MHEHVGAGKWQHALPHVSDRRQTNCQVGSPGYPPAESHGGGQQTMFFNSLYSLKLSY